MKEIDIHKTDGFKLWEENKEIHDQIAEPLKNAAEGAVDPFLCCACLIAALQITFTARLVAKGPCMNRIKAALEASTALVYKQSGIDDPGIYSEKAIKEAIIKSIELSEKTGEDDEDFRQYAFYAACFAGLIVCYHFATIPLDEVEEEDTSIIMRTSRRFIAMGVDLLEETVNEE